jgi:hypothetical protein
MWVVGGSVSAEKISIIRRSHTTYPHEQIGLQVYVG